VSSSVEAQPSLISSNDDDGLMSLQTVLLDDSSAVDSDLEDVSSESYEVMLIVLFKLTINYLIHYFKI